MVKTSYTRLKGSKHLRHRLVLSTLSATPVIIEDIRTDDSWPGLRSHEISLLRLLEKISDDCTVGINETGTKLKYKPGVLIGGRHLVHDCGLNRSIGYFMEPLIVLGLFGKKPLSIRLKGITNDSTDPSVDTFRTTTMHMLKHFGVPLEGLELKIESRGAPPLGGGEVILGVPIIQNNLSATTWVDEGMVKSIRGVTFTTRVSPQFENRMIYAARGIFNRLLPDVHVFTDHKSGPFAGRSAGYGISLVAETTTGCLISADISVCATQENATQGLEESEEKTDLMPPEDLGVKAASMLLEEIEQGGVVDSTHQSPSLHSISLSEMGFCKGLLGVVLSCALAIAAHGDPLVPALMVFGDSITNVGNNNYLSTIIKANFLPFGRDFVTHKPTGRFCKGKLATYFTAESLGFTSYPPTYLSPDAQGENLLIGANFASAASRYFDMTTNLYHAISLTQQLNYYKAYQSKEVNITENAKAWDIFSGTIYLLSAGVATLSKITTSTLSSTKFTPLISSQIFSSVPLRPLFSNGAKMEENIARLLKVAWMTFPIGLLFTFAACILIFWLQALKLYEPYGQAILIHGYCEFYYHAVAVVVCLFHIFLRN